MKIQNKILIFKFLFKKKLFESKKYSIGFVLIKKKKDI